jgi:hypothetical protein
MQDRSVFLTSSFFARFPLASQSMGYMLIAVKPGMVLISLKDYLRPDEVTKKSTRASPYPSIARKIFFRGLSGLSSEALPGRSGSATVLDFRIVIFGIVIIEFRRRQDFSDAGRLHGFLSAAENRAFHFVSDGSSSSTRIFRSNLRRFHEAGIRLCASAAC